MQKSQSQSLNSSPKHGNLAQRQAYLQALHQSYMRKSFIPSYEIKYEISNILESLLAQKQTLKLQLEQQELLSQTITEQQLVNFYCKKEQQRQNFINVEILKRCKEIFLIINTELQPSRSVAESNQLQEEHFIKEFTSFSKLLKLIEQLDNYFSQNQSSIFPQTITNEVSQSLKQGNSSKSTSTTRFIAKLYQSIFTAVSLKQTAQIQIRIQQILAKYNLPFKRNTNEKHLHSLIISEKDKLFLRFILHREACEHALYNLLSSLSNESFALVKPPSIFLTLFFNKLQTSICYLFIEDHQSHSILEPNWMFEYIQQSFNINYQWLKNTLLQSLEDQIRGSVLISVLQYSIQEVFYSNIKKRFEVDLEDNKTSKNAFFYYKFVDTLHQLEEKLAFTFLQEVSLLENLLIQFELKRNIPILQKIFDYEHNWIQQKIFRDFSENINYSHIDLKNIEAYNIVTNFNVLFEKLYSKFSSVYDKQLVQRINQFYQQTVRNLAAHIKTSFERIFNHSGLDRLSIILAFKRVDTQFRSGLNAFIIKDLEFQRNIKKQYYDYIVSLFNEYALQQLSLYHRKLLKVATESEQLFTSEHVTEDRESCLMEKSVKIFKSWQSKLEELNKVYSYRDAKIKNQFFTLLQSINFSEKGVTLFLQFYEPFLKVYYSFQAYNILKMVILMDKRQQLEYLKVHSGLLGFLLSSQFNAIKKLRIK